MNALERAVIEAARAFTEPDDVRAWDRMSRAVDALNEHERAQRAAGLTEITWAQVAEGDQIQGKSGAFYPVVATKREWKLGKSTGKFVITVDMAGWVREIIRPSESQPEAIVKRGDSGKAVDMFVHVFSSGDE